MYHKDWIGRWAVYRPNKIAIRECETGRFVTYSDLNQRANYLAEYFTETLGFQKGDRLMVLAEHSIEYVALFACAQKTGIILVPVNYRLAPPEIDFQIQDAEPKLLLVEAKFEHLAAELEADVTRTSLVELPEGTLEMFHAKEILEDDPVFILYTSGSTGFPKGAIYSHKMLLWNSLNTSQSLELTSGDYTINCMPPFHTGGWNVLLTPMLHRGGSVGLMKKFDADSLLELIDQDKVTLFMGVPTMLKMMSESQRFASSNFSSLRYIIVGGEALPLQVINTWHHKGVMIRQGYGLTEVGPNITSLHQSDAARKLGSIGVPNFYVEYAILDEQQNQVQPGDIGEFCLKGPMVTPGYWQNEDATKQALIDDFFHTGDLVREDEEGFLYIVDRKKCMFISGGENVYPAEVERVLRSHPAINEAAVVGVTDSKWGEVGKAFVSMKNGSPIIKDDLIDHCQQHLAKYKVPRYFEQLIEIPKNSSGKIDRKKLSEL